MVCAPDYRELLGINTVEQLAEAERIHRRLEGRERRREDDPEMPRADRDAGCGRRGG